MKRFQKKTAVAYGADLLAIELNGEVVSGLPGHGWNYAAFCQYGDQNIISMRDVIVMAKPWQLMFEVRTHARIRPIDQLFMKRKDALEIRGEGRKKNKQVKILEKI